jgi:GcrA cell cycle regulator
MIWNSQAINDLKTLWADGLLSTAEIGRRMGCSKNTIVGKRNRLGLEQRPSPFIKGGRLALDTMRAILTSDLNHNQCAEWLGISRDVVRYVRRKHGCRIELEAAALDVQAPCQAVVATSPRRAPPSCCWPFGTPGTKDFHFCEGAEVMPGKPYCAEHTKLAYVHVRERDAWPTA